MNPVRSDHEFAARQAAALRTRMQSLGVVPAPAQHADDVRRLLDADLLLAQFVRAARHTSGSVRAYASLVSDAHADDEDTLHWMARVERGAADLDEFSARMSALRICENERPVSVRWGDILSRVATRCCAVTTCSVETVDRTRAPFVQRAELVGRMLYQLAKNAVEAGPHDAPVRMRVDEFRMGRARAFHLRVTDAGPGPDPARGAEIWRPFVTTRPGHAGLGLAFVVAAASMVGAAVGLRREANRTAAHMLLGEEGGLQWE